MAAGIKLRDVPTKEENFSLIQLLIPVLQTELDLTCFSLSVLRYLHVWATRIRRRLCNIIHGLCEQKATSHPYKSV